MRNFQILVVPVEKSVNNVCKLLQLLRDFHQTPYRDFAPVLYWGISIPRFLWAIALNLKLPLIVDDTTVVAAYFYHASGCSPFRSVFYVSGN